MAARVAVLVTRLVPHPGRRPSTLSVAAFDGEQFGEPHAKNAPIDRCFHADGARSKAPVRDLLQRLADQGFEVVRHYTEAGGLGPALPTRELITLYPPKEGT